MGEDAVVALAYGVTYGMILWFALRLHLRFQRLARKDLASRDLAQRD